MRRIAAEDCGVLVYATGHEGRGIGLINKLQTFVEQDKGHDTLDANLRLGLPVDGRTYDQRGRRVVGARPAVRAAADEQPEEGRGHAAGGNRRDGS